MAITNFEAAVNGLNNIQDLRVWETGYAGPTSTFACCRGLQTLSVCKGLGLVGEGGVWWVPGGAG